MSDPLATVRAFYEAFNSGRLADAAETLAEDVRWSRPPDVPITGTVEGRSGVERMWDAATASLERFQIEPTALSEHGDKVLARITMRGEGRDGGASFEFAGAQVFTVENAEIAAVQEFRSLPEAEAALGG